ncbi:MAG: hypothetical protein EU540_04480 [Promethearchaeota archaeon]|nr:MAG: hypothetical protein EU540_04480 [Candidatus Lokiarchaeota archaeon]
MTVYWAPLLHIYQPPTQEIEILKKIDKECYKPLFSMIDEHDNSKFTLNINGILIELLYEFGLGDTMELLRNLVSENKVEIVGTAKYHPILPLIPKKEVYHQIGMNEEINRKEFGNIWQRNGFFPPELAISLNVTHIIRELGYKWVIMSGIACPENWPYDKIYCSPNGLQLFFRDDIISNKISFKKIKVKEFLISIKEIFLPKKDSKIEKSEEIDRYLVTAMDGETFGWHVKQYEKTFLGKALNLIEKDERIKIVFISELENYFPINNKRINPRDSSWSTSPKDLEDKVPYPLWNHPENNIHKFYWKILKSLNNLMELADRLDLTKNWEISNYYQTARYFYDRGLYSCPLWWSNSIHGMWSPNLIYNGLELLMRSALNAQLALVQAGIEEGEGYFDSISYYHGLLLMEIYSITKKNLKKKIKDI